MLRAYACFNQVKMCYFSATSIYYFELLYGECHSVSHMCRLQKKFDGDASHGRGKTCGNPSWLIFLVGVQELKYRSRYFKL